MSTKTQSFLLSERHIAYIAKYTKASKDDVNSLLKEVALDRPDGRIGKDAFLKWFITMDLKPKERRDASFELIQEHIFRRFDRDRNGYIEISEFLSAIYIMTNGHEKAENIFHLFDIDGDGSLTKDELGVVWHKIFKSKEEFEKMFDEMDQDKNGMISMDEFLSFYPRLRDQGSWTTTL